MRAKTTITTGEHQSSYNTTYVLDTERTYAELESASENKVIKAKLYKKLKYLEPIIVNRLLKRFKYEHMKILKDMRITEESSARKIISDKT